MSSEGDQSEPEEVPTSAVVIPNCVPAPVETSVEEPVVFKWWETVPQTFSFRVPYNDWKDLPYINQRGNLRLKQRVWADRLRPAMKAANRFCALHFDTYRMGRGKKMYFTGYGKCSFEGCVKLIANAVAPPTPSKDMVVTVR